MKKMAEMARERMRLWGGGVWAVLSWAGLNEACSGNIG